MIDAGHCKRNYQRLSNEDERNSYPRKAPYTELNSWATQQPLVATDNLTGINYSVVYVFVTLDQREREARLLDLESS